MGLDLYTCDICDDPMTEYHRHYCLCENILCFECYEEFCKQYGIGKDKESRDIDVCLKCPHCDDDSIYNQKQAQICEDEKALTLVKKLVKLFEDKPEELFDDEGTDIIWKLVTTYKPGKFIGHICDACHGE